MIKLNEYLNHIQESKNKIEIYAAGKIFAGALESPIFNNGTKFYKWLMEDFIYYRYKKVGEYGGFIEIPGGPNLWWIVLIPGYVFYYNDNIPKNELSSDNVLELKLYNKDHDKSFKVFEYLFKNKVFNLSQLNNIKRAFNKIKNFKYIEDIQNMIGIDNDEEGSFDKSYDKKYSKPEVKRMFKKLEDELISKAKAKTKF